MKDTIALWLVLLFFTPAKAQDYSIIPTNPNATGQPGQLFLAQVIVQNNSSEAILIHFERIVNNLPGSWTSCFCYPECMAPWIDTITFSIAGFSQDSIMPNFGTDSIPAMATVKIILNQGGYENSVDTITFTGSTLPAGMAPDQVNDKVAIYPNPFVNYVTLNNLSDGDRIVIRNISGMVVMEKTLVGNISTLDLSFLPAGLYYLDVIPTSGEQRIFKLVRSD